MKPFEPLLHRLATAFLHTIPNRVVLVFALITPVLLVAAAWLWFKMQDVDWILVMIVVEQDWRNPIVIVWATAWLLPWPGRPGLLRRMALSSAVGFVALEIVMLYLRYGWFTGLVELFLP